MKPTSSFCNSRCLRVLALSSLFVLEPKDNASEYADAGTILSDVEMNIAMDEEMNEGLESGLLISQVEAGKCCTRFRRNKP